MTYYFYLWLTSIEEDTPLPYEIKNIYFCLHKECNYFFISYGGNEFPQKKVVNLDYYPLEAQFFDAYKYDKHFSLPKFKDMINEILSYTNSKYLKNKNIFIGNYGSKPTYFIENN